MIIEQQKELSSVSGLFLYYYTLLSLRASLKKFDITIVEKDELTFVTFTPRKSVEFIQCADIKGKGLPPIDQIIFIKRNGNFIAKYDAVEFYKAELQVEELDITGPDGTRTIGKTQSMKEVKKLFDSMEVSVSKESAGFEKVFLKKEELKHQEEEQSSQGVIFYQSTSGVREKLIPTAGFLRTKTIPSNRESAFPNGLPEKTPSKGTFYPVEQIPRVKKKVVKAPLRQRLVLSWQRVLNATSPERRARKRDEVYSSFEVK